MIAKVRAKYLPHADDIEAIFAVGMCPMGLLTPFVLRLWLLYQRETSGHVMPWGYWETPEVYTEARAVIAMEQNAIQNEKDVGPSDGS